MNEMIFLIVLGLVWIIFASVQDLRKREVANWLNFSLIIFALGFRFFYSLFENDFNFLFQGLIGLGIFFVLGNVLYYGRVFAGGDAKLMIALGPVLPFFNDVFSNLRFFLFFLLVFLFVGGIYGLVWSFVLSGKYFKKFKKEFEKQFVKYKVFIYPLLIFSLVVFLLGFFNQMFFYFGLLILIFPFLYIHAKSVEEVCMIKEISTKNLVEGDWLYNDVKVKGRVIRSNWEGLNKKDIRMIQKRYKKVRVKEGIPFVPVFLISFVIMVFLIPVFSVFMEFF